MLLTVELGNLSYVFLVLLSNRQRCKTLIHKSSVMEMVFNLQLHLYFLPSFTLDITGSTLLFVYLSIPMFVLILYWADRSMLVAVNYCCDVFIISYA